MTGYNKNDPASIKKMFNSIAKEYDKTNAILSFCLHKYWNKALVNKAIVPSNPEVLLDLCCGTGAIAFEYLKRTPDPLKVYMLDFSKEMLEYAKLQAKKYHIDHLHSLHFLEANAQSIPLLNNSVNCVTVAYGIRNIKNPDQCIKEVHRILKPGGSFGVLELTQPKNPLLKYPHSLYLRYILPIVGKITASNKEAYSYLCNSIHSFIRPDVLKGKMHAAGFSDVQQYLLLGGIATVLVCKK
jgi:demethylmenaquinone methyltransferase/2-methoxy-6-polyprenyl-1,4-benzoquinol methylase